MSLFHSQSILEEFAVQKKSLPSYWSNANALKALHICDCFPGMSEEAIMELNLPTGIPIVYELDKNLKPVGSMQFLGDEETVKKAMEAVAAQGKVKK